MKHVMRRTKGIRWDLWHRTTVRRSLEMLVMNRVVRRAEVDPPRYQSNGVGGKGAPWRPESFLPSVSPEEPGWFARFFRRRADSSLTHVRHTT